LQETLVCFFNFFRMNYTFWDRNAEVMPTRGEAAKLGPVTLETLNETLNSKINSLDERFDRFEALFTDMKTTMTALKDDINKRFTAVEDDISALQDANIELDSRISYLESTNDMKQKEAELLINGVPMVANENLANVFAKIGTSLGYGETSVPVVEIFRLRPKIYMAKRGNNSKDVTILVKFCSKLEKQFFFKKYLVKRELNLTNIGFETPGRIFVNENLTEANQKIMKAAWNLKKNNKLASVNSYNGIVHIKKLKTDKRGTAVLSIGQLELLAGVKTAANGGGASGSAESAAENN
jgi:hypothetical protein